ncbi:MAG: DUF1501 domain-containing protein [Planctomycetota bacterium]|nr:DUF1501 domain-containing protein [Planctomycetota bacterium]
MFEITGKPYRNCDGITRRSFLNAGTAGMAGVTLAGLLEAESLAGTGNSNKAVINVHLDGGPPQMDMIDLKPEAPSEIRGEFAPIPTRLEGFQICELMPRLAGIADRFAFIRSLVGSAGAHDGFQTQSGYRKSDLLSLGGRPAMGCVLSRLLGSSSDVTPTFVDLMQGRPLVRNSARPGFLGPSYSPFRPDLSKVFERPLEAGMKGELARLGMDHAVSLTLNPSLSLDRLQTRTQLLGGLDRIRRQADATGMMDAMDQFTQQAFGILTSGRFADAMDLSKVDAKTLEKYTPHQDANTFMFATAEGPMSVRKFLLARRLIEAGVRCVSLTISDFDTHSKNFPRMRTALPLVDHGLHALVTDLEESGRLDDVSIVVWGEFGRTPRVDAKTGGRHHWPRVSPGMLAGGGMSTGQVIGATDRSAGTAVERPVHYKDVMATLFHNLGIDSLRTTIDDTRGRPQYLMDDAQPIAELV